MNIHAHSNAVRHVFSKGQPLMFSKGDIIVGNQLDPKGVYFVNTGFVKVYSISNTGDEYIHVIYGTGDVFPIAWAHLDSEPDSLFYEALSACSVWRLSKVTFNEYVDSDRNFARGMDVRVVKQFRNYDDRLDNLEYKNARERIIYGVLSLSGRFGQVKGSTVVLDTPITHETFANSVNLARESVSRHLEKMSKEGLIQMSSNRIVILEPQLLVSKLSNPPNSVKKWRF